MSKIGKDHIGHYIETSNMGKQYIRGGNVPGKVGELMDLMKESKDWQRLKTSGGMSVLYAESGILRSSPCKDVFIDTGSGPVKVPFEEAEEIRQDIKNYLGLDAEREREAYLKRKQGK